MILKNYIPFSWHLIFFILLKAKGLTALLHLQNCRSETAKKIYYMILHQRHPYNKI
jgi:hypothetical protein